jgi:carbonic anhydrase
MKKIVNGYYKFFDQYFEKQSLYQKLFHEQKPEVMFIACCDSRVDPALLVSAQPGDIFVERNVANVVPHRDDGPNSILIALEVALCGFQVKDIVVLGHQKCAGVQMLARNTLHQFGQVPVEYGNREQDLQQAFTFAYDDTTASDFEKLNLAISCKNLLSHEIVADRLKAKRVAVHGWYFSLQTGRLETLCFSCHQFTDLMVQCCGKRVF